MSSPRQTADNPPLERTVAVGKLSVMQLRAHIRAGSLAVAKLLAMCYGAMAIGFPLVIRAFGLTWHDGWALLTARHYGLLIMLAVAPLILAGLAVFQLIMHEWGGVHERKAPEHKGKLSPEDAE